MRSGSLKSPKTLALGSVLWVALACDTFARKEASLPSGGQPAAGKVEVYPGAARRILAELNRLRRKPSGFVPVLEDYRRRFRGSQVHRPGEPILLTQEGPAAVAEAIAFLEQAPSRPALRLASGMSRAAADHVRDLGPTGEVGHYGSDGSSPASRLKRYGSWQRQVGENVSFGEEDPRRVVLQMLVDDGVADRGHRKNLFSPDYRVVGIACGAHARYRHMCVIDFAWGFVDRGKLGGGSDP